MTCSPAPTRQRRQAFAHAPVNSPIAALRIGHHDFVHRSTRRVPLVVLRHVGPLLVGCAWRYARDLCQGRIERGTAASKSTTAGTTSACPSAGFNLRVGPVASCSIARSGNVLFCGHRYKFASGSPSRASTCASRTASCHVTLLFATHVQRPSTGRTSARVLMPRERENRGLARRHGSACSPQGRQHPIQCFPGVAFRVRDARVLLAIVGYVAEIKDRCGARRSGPRIDLGCFLIRDR